MTQALYLSEIESVITEVLVCQSTPDGRFAVQLEHSPFHPQGGGQPSDVGTIHNVPVLHVMMDGEKMIHYCSSDVALGTAIAKIDMDKRKLHSRLHSAGHLIAHIMQSLGWTAIKAQHWPNDAKVQFKAQDQSQTPDLQCLEKMCNEYIQKGLKKHISESLEGYREVAFGDLGRFPCGGTHVNFLSEIIRMNIDAIKMKKGILSIKYTVSEEN